MFGMGMPEIIMILAIALIVIGPRKLPDLGRSLGRAMREFRKATSEFKSSLNIDDDLGDVRRSFSEMNSDLKSTLTAAAFGDKKQPAAEVKPGAAPESSGSVPPQPEPAETSEGSDSSAPPAAKASDAADATGQERGDAGR